MAAQMTLTEVLEQGIEKEIHSQLLYADLGQAVKEPAARDAFAELAKQEKGHQQVLEQYLRGELREGALQPLEVMDYKIAEYFDLPDISADMSLPDVFLLAAKREKTSYEFYTDFARAHPPGKVKTLLNRLASQELEHKQRVEFLYTEVAFPQTDGG